PRENRRSSKRIASPIHTAVQFVLVTRRVGFLACNRGTQTRGHHRHMAEVRTMEEAQNRITAKARELRAEALKLLACLGQPNVQWEIARHGMFASWIAGGIAIALGAGYVASSGSYWPAAKWAAIGVYAAWMAAGSILLILGWVLSGFAEEDMPKEPWAA